MLAMSLELRSLSEASPYVEHDTARVVTVEDARDVVDTADGEEN